MFTVCKLDRFARSVSDLSVQSRALQEKGVELQVLDLGLDTSTPTGKLMMNLLGSIAEFERELMLERQKVGIEKAKAAGKFKGRAPTARAKKEQIQKLTAAGLRPSDIAKQLDIGVASVYRYRT